jgi:hypothetical protein
VSIVECEKKGKQREAGRVRKTDRGRQKEVDRGANIKKVTEGETEKGIK